MIRGLLTGLVGLGLLAGVGSAASAAVAYGTNDQKCYGFPRVPSLKTPAGVCVGLVASKKDVAWNFPRKVLFVNGDAYVSAFGGWKKNEGQLWKVDLKSNPGRAKITNVFNKTDRTHGLRLGPDGKIYYGDARTIYRFPVGRPDLREVAVDGLPDVYVNDEGKEITSNHPLSEFIFLGDGSLLVNVGAPSNDCVNEFRDTKGCAQRDQQADLRLFQYDARSGRYSQDFVRLAKGLRNSMGLLYNERLNEVYQAENAADEPGTPDEMNLVNLNTFNPAAPFDYGWPYCFGMGERYKFYPNFKTFCGSRALKPLFLLPAHAAPLDAMYYVGRMFRDLTDKILITFHGHRPSGSRVAVIGTDRSLRPTGLESYFVDGWQEDARGRHPKGAPVGIAADDNGALFVVDDKNHALLVVASTNEDGKTDPVTPPAKPVIDGDIEKYFTKPQLDAWAVLFKDSFTRTTCSKCHGDVVKDGAPKNTLKNMMNARWLSFKTPLANQPLWQRINGLNGVRIMPPPDEGKSLPDWAKQGDPALARLKAFVETLRP